MAQVEGKIRIDEIVKLGELVPRDLSGAPEAIIVESQYSNLDGVYQRQPVAHLYFPVYLDKKSLLYIWHDLFRNEWTCSEEIDSDKYMWRVPGSSLHALSPSTSDLDKMKGDGGVTAITDTELNSIRPVHTSRMPKAVVIFSEYTNRRGIFTRLPTPYEGFPAFTNTEEGLSLWHDLGGRWVCSESVGSDAKRAWRIKSNARSPDLIQQKEVDALQQIDRILSLAEVGPAQNLDQAPAAIVIKSKFANVAGVYEQYKDPYLTYPVYYSGKTEFYVWYEVWQERWLSSTELGGGNIAWWMPCDTRALSPSTVDLSQMQGKSQITDISDETWTWGGNIDPKYTRKDRLFTDNAHLPPNWNSIGKLSGDAGAEVQWIRAMDLNRDHDDHLWLDITPNDMMQGSVGDCWLIAAFSGLARFPHLIENVFVTKALSSEGQYKLRFWEVRTGEWVVITIDDFIPCKKRTRFQRTAEPLFVRARHEGELWPLLLEKGFAAFVGSYGELTSGEPSFAWQALTGCSLISFSREDMISTDWKVAFNDVNLQRVRMLNETDTRRRMGFMSWDKLRLSADNLFTSLERLNRKGQVMSAVIDKDVMLDMEQEIINAGLEADHAFTVLEVLELESYGLMHRLVCLRNPWGNVKSWLGAWGKDSPEWEKYPELTRRIDELFGGRRTEDDGVFWMSWQDFLQWFTTVDASSNIPPKQGTPATVIEGSPDAIVVISRFVNRASVFEINKRYAFPVYEAVSTAISPESRFIWYDYNSAIWVCSPKAGSFSGIAWGLWSTDHDPSSLDLGDLQGVDRIVRLDDIIPKNVDDAPTAVIVESEYSNLDGVYWREPDVHLYFPVYHNANTGMYWWHNLFRNEWFCSQSVGGTRYMWKVPSSSLHALSPSTNDVHTLETDNKITIRDADPRSKRVVIDLPKMPKAVVVYSKYVNRRGIYTRSSSTYEGYPVYIDAEGGLSLWHDVGGRWVCSGTVGSEAKKAWRIKSDVKSPDLIKQREVDAVDSIDRVVSLSDVAPDDLNKAPGAVKIESIYQNVKGKYNLQCGHYLHFPVYYCEPNESYLWHDFWHKRWVCSDKIGGNQYMWRIKSNKDSLSPTDLDLVMHGVDGDVGISKITVMKAKAKFTPKSPKELKHAVDKCLKQSAKGYCSSSDTSIDLT